MKRDRKDGEHLAGSIWKKWNYRSKDIEEKKGDIGLPQVIWRAHKFRHEKTGYQHARKRLLHTVDSGKTYQLWLKQAEKNALKSTQSKFGKLKKVHWKQQKICSL